MKFFKYINQNSSGQLQYPTIQMAIQSFKSSMTTEFLGSSILIRIVLIHLKKERKSPTNIAIRKLDYHRILMKFYMDFDQNSLQKFRWPRNSYEILQGFLSEFWWPALVSNKSDDYQILQELDDHGILM